jgi:hypothetical protein
MEITVQELQVDLKLFRTTLWALSPTWKATKGSSKAMKQNSIEKDLSPMNLPSKSSFSAVRSKD